MSEVQVVNLFDTEAVTRTPSTEEVHDLLNRADDLIATFATTFVVMDIMMGGALRSPELEEVLTNAVQWGNDVRVALGIDVLGMEE